MFGFLGKIFGSDSVINKGASLIDSAFFTEQEKSQEKRLLLQAYEPFKLAQRLLALLYTVQILILVNTALILHLNGNDYSVIMDIAEAYNIPIIALIIIGFYFGGGATEGVINAKAKAKIEQLKVKKQQRSIE